MLSLRWELRECALIACFKSQWFPFHNEKPFLRCGVNLFLRFLRCSRLIENPSLRGLASISVGHGDPNTLNMPALKEWLANRRWRTVPSVKCTLTHTHTPLTHSLVHDRVVIKTLTDELWTAGFCRSFKRETPLNLRRFTRAVYFNPLHHSAAKWKALIHFPQQQLWH